MGRERRQGGGGEGGGTAPRLSTRRDHTCRCAAPRRSASELGEGGGCVGEEKGECGGGEGDVVVAAAACWAALCNSCCIPGGEQRRPARAARSSGGGHGQGQSLWIDLCVPSPPPRPRGAVLSSLPLLPPPQSPPDPTPPNDRDVLIRVALLLASPCNFGTEI